MSAPKQFLGIMVSSTYEDLEHHRGHAINAIHGNGFMAHVMENDGALPDQDLIESSLRMVRESAGYVGVIGHCYGRSPICAKRNPDGLSLTELEFDEAMALKLPMVLLIMSDSHLVPRNQVDDDPERNEKLKRFIAKAKRMRADSEVERVYEVFDSIDDFRARVERTVAKLATHIRETFNSVARADEPNDAPVVETASTAGKKHPSPPKPAWVPKYQGSHAFIGREAELTRLTEWAHPDTEKSVMLFEAIGGAGKSMLTWEWFKNHAPKVRDDWAGRFWYSFYERGAVMADFCRNALAYMTDRPLEAFKDKHTLQLRDELIEQLENRPWLIVLDGLERVLVAYHRYDSAQLTDDVFDNPTAQDKSRDPTSSIRPEDDDLLRDLAAVDNSKILISSRLRPVSLFNSSDQALPNVEPFVLQGLQLDDAEKMIRACGVHGDSEALRRFLVRNCAGHPLVIGALAGLINTYPKDPGNFDAWLADKVHGGKLDFSELDLTKRRNKLMEEAISAVPSDSQDLLRVMALLDDAIDFETLCALMAPRNEDDAPVIDQDVVKRVAALLLDLKKRGLVQYDDTGKSYDLHPVVRGITATAMHGSTKSDVGERIVDHFTANFPSSWENVQTRAELIPLENTIGTLIKIGQMERASRIFAGDYSSAILAKFGHDEKSIELSEAFVVPTDGIRMHDGLSNQSKVIMLTFVISSRRTSREPFNELEELALEILGMLNKNEISLLSFCAFLRSYYLYTFTKGQIHSRKVVSIIRFRLSIITENSTLAIQNSSELLSTSDTTRIEKLNFRSKFLFKRFKDSFDLTPNAIMIYQNVNNIFKYNSKIIDRIDVESYLNEDLKREYPIFYFTGAYGILYHDIITNELEDNTVEKQLSAATELCEYHRSRGHLSCGAESMRAILRLRLDPSSDESEIARRIAAQTGSEHLMLALLWHELGNGDNALKHARTAFQIGIGDGDPYVDWRTVEHASSLLRTLGETPPEIPKFDPSKHPPAPWEVEVNKYIFSKYQEKRARFHKELRAKKARGGSGGEA